MAPKKTTAKTGTYHEISLPPSLLGVLPRGKDKLFTDSSRDALQDLLPHYQHEMEPWQGLARIEGFFFVDLAADRSGTWMAHRKLTAVFFKQKKGEKLDGKKIEWRRTSGSNKLRFVKADTSLGTELTGSDAVTTDAEGLAEVTICHPAESVSAADRDVTIEARLGRSAYEITLKLRRNDAVTNIDLISRKTSTEAAELWVYQPNAADRSPANDGIKDLQETLNEVVSRHHGIPAAGANRYRWIRKDGIYGDRTKRALDQYLQTFSGIAAGADYPYDLRNIKIADELRDYIKSEYAPFDPDAAANRGSIVDRHLLIGEAWYGGDTRRIDGLVELKEGVVDRLQSEMDRLAQEYIGCPTFWLHRPDRRGVDGHVPYTQSADRVARIRAGPAVTVKQAAGAGSPDLLDAAGNAVTVSPGQAFPSPALGGGWTQINIGGTLGWVPNVRVRRVRDDQAIPRNHGNHGAGPWADGVAYSFGCKDLPASYSARLGNNPFAPPADGPDHHRRIADWEEYQNGHRVGRRNTDAGWAGNNRIPYHTGCDCSGLVQNGITQAVYADLGSRIVPNSLTRAINVRADGTPQHAIPSGGFVGRRARRVPMPVDQARHWVRRGDLIAGGGHIVMVADPVPNMLNAAGGFLNTFEVLNAYGNDRYWLSNNTRAPIDNTRFLRKSIRMPYHYWRVRPGVRRSVGKPFIWQ